MDTIPLITWPERAVPIPVITWPERAALLEMLSADLFTVAEYAELTGRRGSSIRRSIANGSLKAVQVGREWLIHDPEKREG